MRTRSTLASAALAAATAVAGIAAVAPMGAGGAAAAGPTLPLRPGAMQRWSAAHMATVKNVTAATASSAAARFDVMTVGKREFGAYATRMRAVNPRLVMAVYVNGAFLSPTEARGVPESLVAHDAQGRRITSRKWGNVLMDVTSPTWRSMVVRECAAARASARADGCYLDMLGTAVLSTGFVTSLPVDPRTGRTWTDAAYIRATAAIAAAVRDQTPGPVICNGIANGQRYFRGADSSRPLLEACDAGHAEVWMRTADDPVGAFPTPEHWKQNVDLLVDAGSRGRVVLAMTKLWVGASAAQRDQWHRFAVASFLLGTDGRSYFTFTAGRTLADATADSALDRVQVGQPRGGYRRQGAAYLRTFSAGVAVVNPSGAPVTVRLDRSYRSLSGQVTGVLRLPAHAGDVLTVP